jgi:photosystem II stability/assembly factor-like uncharacterized protein
MPAHLVSFRRLAATASALMFFAVGLSCNKSSPFVPTGPVISLSTTQLNFYGAAGGGNPARQLVLARNAGVDSLHFSVTYSQSWLDLSVVPGNSADSIFASAYISGKPAGIYYDTIIVSSEKAMNSPQLIAVTATVRPTVMVSQPVLLFETLVNGPDPDPKILTITSTGTNGVTFTVAKSQAWLLLSKMAGSTPDEIAVSINNAGLLSGTYYDTVVMATASLVTPTIRIPVTLTVRSWASFTVSGSNDLRGVHIIDDQVALAVGFIGNTSGHKGVILKTIDAGKTWQAKKYVDNTSLGGIDFVDASNGWAVGDSGVILYTFDGGESWKQIPDITLPIHDTVALWRVQFADLAHGWIIGVKGTLLRTVDTGKTWTIQTTPPSSFSLADIEMNSSIAGWIVGNHGTILHTSDGDQWVPQISSSVRDLWAISMIDDLNGWIVGTDGEMLKTINGGTTWEPRSSGETAELNDIFFVNPTTGWAVGNNGVIIRYQPATDSWWRQNSGTTRTLFNASFTASGYGVVVGELGTILLTYNGGL